MLIQFSVENFLSFKDEVKFSMVAGRTRKHRDHIITTGKRNDIRLLKTGVIYGANASGKSNLIKAMAFAQDFVTRGTLNTKYISLAPFLFDSVTANEPSTFRFEIKCETRSYIYGFAVDRKQVHSEELYEIRPASEKLIFKRKTDLDGRAKIEFGKLPLTAEQHQELLDSIVPERLLLTESVKMEQRISYFEDVYRWFDYTLVPVFPSSKPSGGIGIGFMKYDDFHKRFYDLIEQLDLGIDDIGPVRYEFNAKELTDEFKKKVKRHIQDIPEGSNERAIFYNSVDDYYLLVDSDNQYTAYKVVTLHHVKHENRNIAFSLNAEGLNTESDGTIRILELVPTLLGLLDGHADHVFVIDELDRSLHAHLSYKVLELFLNNSGLSSSQMIVTTHESNLLDLDLLRRDEIWFIEKDAEGASTVFSLEEFHPRHHKDVRKSYLQGRFGAIPLLPSRRSLELQR